MNKAKIIKLFNKIAAIRPGHFLLTSGLHSNTYIQCARILEQPRLLAGLVKQLASPWRKMKIDVVAGPAVGGIILAYELARLFKARAIYLERLDNKLSLRRGFTVEPKERVLVVEDVITTGGSVKETASRIK
ncbi:MAG: phosphoribosyltransferase family protein [Planctomycetota bacterium]